VAAAIADELTHRDGGSSVRFDEGVTPEMLRGVATHELAAAVVMESPAAARQHGIRIDTLRDEPLLAALPESHGFARADAIPVSPFAAQVVMLPQEPPGQMFKRLVSDGAPGGQVRVGADDEEAERAVGPADLAGCERRGGLPGGCGVAGGRPGCGGSAVRSAAQLSMDSRRVGRRARPS
jgi:hypothetical protein